MRYAILILLFLAALGGIWWFTQPPRTVPGEPSIDFDSAPAPRPEPRYPLPQPEPLPDPEPLTLLEPEPEPADPLQPEPGEAVPEPEPAAEPEPLPSLIDSDPAALTVLRGLIGVEAVARWIRPEWIISRTVVVVHSLDGAAPPVEVRPLTLLRRAPQTGSGSADGPYWTEATAQRYADLVEALETVPPATAAAQYRRHYPLFQEAWEELGEPEPWFNDRLIDIIDHLLAAPEVALPIELVPWENRLKFADDELEAQSWGRKLLIRLGPDQAADVKGWLRALRRDLTGQPGLPQA